MIREPRPEWRQQVRPRHLNADRYDSLADRAWLSLARCLPLIVLSIILGIGAWLIWSTLAWPE